MRNITRNNQQNLHRIQPTNDKPIGRRYLQHVRTKLKGVVENQTLSVHYQPQLDLDTRRCRTHLEAFVRWSDNDLGNISPSVFIPLAEELGLVHEITRFVIHTVQRDIRSWRLANVPVETVAVNISAKSFATQNETNDLVGWLTAEETTSKSITLELTETAMVQNKTLARNALLKLKELGFHLALDDFGTGYSSLAYLLEFPIDVIKIDKSFVSSLDISSRCRVIVQSLINMANKLGLATVAEGVECAQQLSMLRQWNCSLVQGFYIGKPMPKILVANHLQHLSAVA